MGKMKYIITIKDTHIVGDEKESSELMITGGLNFFDGGYKIRYKETDEGYEGCFITLKCENGKKVTMTRLGSFSTQMIMELDKRHICCYSTPMGELSLGVYASKVESDVTPEGGTLKMVYSLDIEGSYMSENFLDITLKRL